MRTAAMTPSAAGWLELPRRRVGDRSAALRLLVATLAALALAGCDSDDETTAEPSAAEHRPEPTERRCGSDAAWEGGQVLETPDGARIYYRVAGPEGAPVAVYLHGGPGYNAYGFERAVGAQLERSLRMVYLDQRGCGRSQGGPPDLALGMDPTVADLERLREALSVRRWTVIGHSFGGLVALVYAKRHPDAIDRLVLVEATADPAAALEHQIAVLAEGTAQTRPEIAAIARQPQPPLERMIAIYQMLGRAEVQRRLHWADEHAQRRAEGWDSEALLADCSRDGVLPSYRQGGWIAAHPEILERLPRPALYIAGRQSHVMAPELIAQHAERWGARVVWMEQSGHFPFIEEPEPFAQAVVAFVTSERSGEAGAATR